MEFIFCMQINIVGTIVFYGSAQTFLKYPKKVGNSFAMYYEESVATAFLFYFDPKHLYILRWSSHVSCYLFLSVTSFSVIATLFDVPSCILKLKDFNCCNSLTPLPSLNWVIKLSSNWVTLSLLEIVRWCIPKTNLIGPLDHTVGFTDSFQFCVSLIGLYNYL